jgi:large subunit ribosomal protein L23
MAMGLFEKKTKKISKETKTIVSKNSLSSEKFQESEKPFDAHIPLKSYTILRAPRITEKASMMSAPERNVYVFQVANDSSKGSVKDAVESLYKVNVKRVRTVQTPSKKRRLGKFQGFRKGFKKAYVTLQEGQKIDLGTGA